jgi:hypothetical protein
MARVRSFNRAALARLPVSELLELVGRLDALPRPADTPAVRRLARHRDVARAALAAALAPK